MADSISCEDLIRGQLARRYAGAMNPRTSELLARLDPNDKDALNSFIRKVDRPRFTDLIYSYWLASILSGPATHIRNIAGNAIYGLAEIPVRAGRGGLDALLTGLRVKPERETYAGESLVLARAYFTGIPQGLSRALKAFVTHGDDLASGKLTGKGGALEGRRADPWEHLESRVGRGVGRAVTAPLRALSAEDAFFRTIAETAEQHAWAYRKARQEGLKGDAAADRVAELMVELPEEMVEAGKKLGEKLTFTDAPSWFGRGVANFRNIAGRAADEATNPLARGALRTADLAMKGTMPFVNVPDRLIVRGLEFTPVGLARGAGQLYGATRARKLLPDAERNLERIKDLARSQPEADMKKQLAYAQRQVDQLREQSSTVEASDLLTRGIMGSTLGIALLQGYGAEMFTGAAPTDAREREAFFASGKKPWAVRVGDTWVPYGRTDPLGNALGLMAIWAGTFGDKDEDTLAEEATEFAVEFGKLLLDKGTMTGVSDILEVFQTGGYNPAGERLKVFLARQAGGALPWSAFNRTIAQTMDPGLVQREGPLDYIKENVPRNPLTPDRADLAPRLDSFGQQIQVAEHNPIARALEGLTGANRNRFAPILASGTPLDLSQEARDPVREMLGNLPGRPRGPEREDAIYGPIEREELERLLASPGWPSLTPKGQQIAVERAKDRARNRYDQMTRQGGP